MLLLMLLAAAGATSDNYRLPLTVIPHHYSIKLVPYLEERNFTFDGEVDITVTAITDSNNVTLHYMNLEILETPSVISTDGLHALKVVETNYHNDTNFYTLIFNESLVKDRDYRIHIKYLGYNEDSTAGGFYRCSYEKDTGEQRWFAVTYFEPAVARKAFPCFDEPALKAIFSIKIARPADYQAVSNMPRINVSAPDLSVGGRIWDTFEETPLISTYLVAFMVSDLKNLSTADGKYSMWGRENVVWRANHTLELTQTVVEFMENYTGIKYSLPKLDSVAEPCYRGGMENWGLIVYQEWEVLQSDYQTVFKERNLQDIVVHELAHMWFGNLVTPTWWDNLWLKEAFARYFELLVTHELRPEWRKDEHFLVDIHQHALHLDETETFPIIVDTKNPNDTPLSLLFYIVYEKAASIVRMMAHFLTHATFQKGLRRYLKDHAFGVADADELFQILNDAQRQDRILPTGVDVKTVMDSWTLQDSFPVLHVHRKHGYINITQEAFVKDGEDSGNKKKLWWIPISYTTSAYVDFTNTQSRAWLRGEPSITLQENLTDSHWIILNIQATGFYRVNYDLDTWSLIIAYMNSAEFKHIHVMNRAQLLDDAFFLVNHSLINITTFLDLSLYLTRETEYIPWYTFFSIVSRINKFLDGKDIYDSFRHYVLVLMKNLYDSTSYEEQKTDTHMTKMTRFTMLYWACYLGYRDCVRWAANHYTAWLQNPTNTTLSLDLRSIVYCTALSQDDNVNWRHFWDVFVEHNMSKELIFILAYFQCTDHYKDMAKQNVNVSLAEEAWQQEEIDNAGNAIRGGIMSKDPKVFNKQLNYSRSISGNLLDADMNLQDREKSESYDENSPLSPEIYRTMKMWLMNFERHHTLS